jgi:hypothetical protein
VNIQDSGFPELGAREADAVKQLSGAMNALVVELQGAQKDFEAITARPLEKQRPLFRVLKLELINHLKVTAEHVAQLRFFIKEITSDSEADFADRLSNIHEHGGTSLVEHVDAIVTAALGDKPLVRS